MTPRQKIQAARTALVLDQPFFGALALRLKVIEDPGCGTAWTNGEALGYDPEFVMRLTHDEVVGVIAHEVMHCANGHMWRRDGREQRKFNVAADLAINPVLREAGFRLPQGALLEQQYLGKSAEWIYARLPDQPQGGAGKGQGKGDGQGQGKGQAGQPDAPGSGQGAQGQVPGAGACDVRDAPAEDADGASEADWQQAVQQAAAAAKGRGKLPASLARLANEAAAPKVDWRSVLHRFVQQAARDDYSWTRPNARYLAGGLYLPSLRSETVGPIAVAIDTSGSVDGVLLNQFAAELRAVVDDVRPARVHVLYCDAKVHRVDTFERDDAVELNPAGGGGTAFAPVMDACEQLDEPPVCLVYLTDLDGSHRAEPPDFPVLWAATQRRDVPYGEVVMVE
jgi:predicted metal-dependent peptidase